MEILVLYYSIYGHVYELAKKVAKVSYSNLKQSWE